MKIFPALNNGFKATLKSWKGVVIIWVIAFVLISFVKTPLKGSLNTLFGSSMITERMMESADIEVFADLGMSQLRAVFMSLLQSLGFAWLIAVFVNIFLSGGIFDYLSDTTKKFKLKGFLKASCDNFSSFFVIKLFSSLLVVVCAFCLYLFYYLIMSSDGVAGHIICGVLAIMVLFFMVQILIASDYARAKKVTRPDAKGSKAFSYGFKVAFSRYLLPSQATMIIVLAVQALIVFPFINVFMRWFPQSGGGIFMLFVCPQLIYLLKVFLKVWRFGSMTHLMQQIPVTANVPVSELIQEESTESEIITAEKEFLSEGSAEQPDNTEPRAE